MEGGERKEAAALPSDYVSLAQLQERWLQKQEETKLKQKREEEEKRERDALALKQKQKWEERERDSRAQNRWRSRNQNQRGGAKIGGGFVRATGEILEKGKEIVCGGPGDGGENNKNIGKKGGKGKKKRNFKGAAAIEEREKVGAEAEVLILSEEGGSACGSSAVELVACVSVVEVLPRNGEVAPVNRSDLRGGFKKNGRDKGSLRVNELKQSEEEGGGKKCSGSGKGEGKGRDGGSERGGDRVRGSEEKGERRRGSERGRDRRGGERWGGEGGSERG
ncbi:eukaryotic translation initiation factor 3 subunit A-like [Salvia splendens]|uniref:eukaryotic translation initiation factor 3 subunit A-like n=1 Tax=Salvia splendens TaxID=180675 RepID=UPI001C2741BF|nr:eukaryotic translation initiation factor 3 subunit A-like [Salvia splendens]